MSGGELIPVADSAVEVGLRLLPLLRRSLVAIKRQLQILNDPSKACRKLLENIAVLERMADEADERNEDVSNMLELVNSDIQRASNKIRLFRRLAARKRYIRMTEFQGRLAEMNRDLNFHIKSFDALLKQSKKHFNLDQIRHQVTNELSADGYQTKRRERLNTLIKNLSAAAKEGDKTKVHTAYYELSNFLAADSIAVRDLNPRVQAQLRKTKGDLSPRSLKLEPYETGMPDLDPICLKTVHCLTSTGIVTQIDSSKMVNHYHIFDRNNVRSLKTACGMTNDAAFTGKLSNLHEVTVPEVTRRTLLIPDEAHTFAFLYPMNEKQVVERVGLASPTPLESLLIHGGYVYFDRRGNFLRANYFVSGRTRNASICFNNPVRLENSMRDALIDANRFSEVTISQLVDQGARKFAWVTPGEEFPGCDSSGWKHGGFAYIYDDSSKNNVFGVASLADVLGINEVDIKSCRPHNAIVIPLAGDETVCSIYPEDVEHGGNGCCTIS